MPRCGTRSTPVSMPFNTDTPKRHSCRGGPQGVRPASAVGRPEDVARGLLPPDGREVDAGLGDVVGLAVGVALGGLLGLGGGFGGFGVGLTGCVGRAVGLGTVVGGAAADAGLLGSAGAGGCAAGGCTAGACEAGSAGLTSAGEVDEGTRGPVVPGPVVPGPTTGPFTGDTVPGADVDSTRSPTTPPGTGAGPPAMKVIRATTDRAPPATANDSNRLAAATVRFRAPCRAAWPAMSSTVVRPRALQARVWPLLGSWSERVDNRTGCRVRATSTA